MKDVANGWSCVVSALVYLPPLCADVRRLTERSTFSIDMLVQTNYHDLSALCPIAKRVDVDPVVKRTSEDFLRRVTFKPAVCGTRPCRSHLGPLPGARRWILRWTFVQFEDYAAIVILDSDASVQELEHLRRRLLQEQYVWRSTVYAHIFDEPRKPIFPQRVRLFDGRSLHDATALFYRLLVQLLFPDASPIHVAKAKVVLNKRKLSSRCLW